MAKRKPNVVAVVAGAFYGQETAQGATDYFRTHGQWEVRYEGSVSEGNALQAIREWHADGIILQVNSPTWIPKITRACRAVVNVCGRVSTKLPTVITDNLAIGQLAARHFLERRFRHFAAYGPGDTWFWLRREEGFTRELAQAGFQAHVRRARGTYKEDRVALAHWLGSLPTPVGVLGGSDYWARDVVQACAKAGLAVPTQVAVVGVDNDPVLCELETPPMSSVIIPVRRIGYEAARLLDSLLQGHRPPDGPMLLPPPGIATRQSSDVMAIEDTVLAQAHQFMRANADKLIDISSVLAHVHLSRRALEMRFRKTLGVTPQMEIRRLHIERAKLLLAQSKLKVSQVALQSGFSGYEVFSRIFKATAGISPGEYRRQFGSPD